MSIEIDVSHCALMVQATLQECACAVSGEMMRPSVLYRPSLSIDGNQWCALYGNNLQEGCAGFGDTPAKAMADFDCNWNTALAAQGGE